MRQKLTQLSEHIWLWPHHRNPNMVQASIGVIAGDDETILVDAGNSPKLARRLKRELHRTGLPPVGRIIYTHHHWDHVWGACVFQVPVIAHASCQTILQEEARKPWSSAYLDQLVAKNPLLKISCTAQKKAIDDWESFHIVVPNTTFEERMTIEPAPLTIELEYVGGQHAQDSIVVKIPQEDLIFLGDCYYVPPLHLRTPKSAPSISMLASLAAGPFKIYAEGHDAPFSKEELLEFLEADQEI